MSIGHGAAECTMWRSDDTSYFARTSSGSCSIRWNWVGTMCEVVTLYRWIRYSVCSGSHLSIWTRVWPMCTEFIAKRITAVWYIGDDTR